MTPLSSAATRTSWFAIATAVRRISSTNVWASTADTSTLMTRTNSSPDAELPASPASAAPQPVSAIAPATASAPRNVVLISMLSPIFPMMSP